MLGKLVKKKLLTKLGLNHVRYAFTAAAPLPTDIILWYRNLGLELLEVYGMTENLWLFACDTCGAVCQWLCGACPT